MSWLRNFCVIVLHAILFIPSVFATNLKIDNLRIENNYLLANLTWENSWFESENNLLFRDGVWCFMKVRSNEGKWQHVYFQANDIILSSEHSRLETVRDSAGFFLQSIHNGTNQSQLKIQLPEEIALQNGIHDVALFAIEMVWVDEGSFYVGDGVHSQNSLRSGDSDTTTVKPFLIASENEISVGKAANQLYGNVEEEWAGQATIPASFPKGFKGFWVMKYEINQTQYKDFLNTLTFSQQQSRTSVSPESESKTSALAPANALQRNAIFIKEKGNQFLNQSASYGLNANGNASFDEEADGLYRACNWLNANDVVAFLDWAALRPITELEFEKACRGAVFPQKGEFAWGTAYIIDANTVSQDGQFNETVLETASDSAGLAPYNTGIQTPQLQGVLRNGFGATATPSRLQAGGSFFGVFELSGNVWELCIKINSLEALRYQGQLGNGKLDENGNADAWNIDITTSTIVRGGAWDSVVYGIEGFRDLSVSARYYATLSNHIRRGTTGGRGGR